MGVRGMRHFPWRTFSIVGFQQPVTEPVSLWSQVSSALTDAFRAVQVYRGPREPGQDEPEFRLGWPGHQNSKAGTFESQDQGLWREENDKEAKKTNERGIRPQRLDNRPKKPRQAGHSDQNNNGWPKSKQTFSPPFACPTPRRRLNFLSGFTFHFFSLETHRTLKGKMYET